jgi:hypothetical protein
MLLPPSGMPAPSEVEGPRRPTGNPRAMAVCGRQALANAGTARGRGAGHSMLPRLRLAPRHVRLQHGCARLGPELRSIDVARPPPSSPGTFGGVADSGGFSTLCDVASSVASALNPVGDATTASPESTWSAPRNEDSIATLGSRGRARLARALHLEPGARGSRPSSMATSHWWD